MFWLLKIRKTKYIANSALPSWKSGRFSWCLLFHSMAPPSITILLPNFPLILLLLVISFSFSLLIRHLASQMRRSSTSACFFQKGSRRLQQHYGFPGPAYDLLNDVYKNIKWRLFLIIYHSSLVSRLFKNMYSLHPPMLVNWM